MAIRNDGTIGGQGHTQATTAAKHADQNNTVLIRVYLFQARKTVQNKKHDVQPSSAAGWPIIVIVHVVALAELEPATKGV